MPRGRNSSNSAMVAAVKFHKRISTPLLGNKFHPLFPFKIFMTKHFNGHKKCLRKKIVKDLLCSKI